MLSSVPFVVLDTCVVSMIFNKDSRASIYENRIEGLRLSYHFRHWRNYVSGRLRTNGVNESVTN